MILAMKTINVVVLFNCVYYVAELVKYTAVLCKKLCNCRYRDVA